MVLWLDIMGLSLYIDSSLFPDRILVLRVDGFFMTLEATKFLSPQLREFVANAQIQGKRKTWRDLVHRSQTHPGGRNLTPTTAFESKEIMWQH